MTDSHPTKRFQRYIHHSSRGEHPICDLCEKEKMAFQCTECNAACCPACSKDHQQCQNNPGEEVLPPADAPPADIPPADVPPTPSVASIPPCSDEDFTEEQQHQEEVDQEGEDYPSNLEDPAAPPEAPTSSSSSESSSSSITMSSSSSSSFSEPSSSSPGDFQFKEQWGKKTSAFKRQFYHPLRVEGTSISEPVCSICNKRVSEKKARNIDEFKHVLDHHFQGVFSFVLDIWFGSLSFFSSQIWSSWEPTSFQLLPWRSSDW